MPPDDDLRFTPPPPREGDRVRIMLAFDFTHGEVRTDSIITDEPDEARKDTTWPSP